MSSIECGRNEEACKTWSKILKGKNIKVCWVSVDIGNGSGIDFCVDDCNEANPEQEKSIDGKICQGFAFHGSFFRSLISSYSFVHL
jgi:hypothetical protein